MLGVLLFNKSLKQLFVNMLPIKLVGLIIRGMSKDTGEDILFEGSIIGIFFSLKLIQYKSNKLFDNRYP